MRLFLCFCHNLDIFHLVSISRGFTPFKVSCKTKCNFTLNLVAAELPLVWCNISTSLKAMFCSIVLIRRITITIQGRNVSTFITVEVFALSCFMRKVSVS